MLGYWLDVILIRKDVEERSRWHFHFRSDHQVQIEISRTR